MKLAFLRSLLLLSFLVHCLAYGDEDELGDKKWVQLSRDQPLYFLFGTPNAKVQLSLKAKILASTNLYVAYTQRMFWNILQKSAPIRDINYNPSVFYRFHLGDESKTVFDFIAYEHESNGGDDPQSRSWNRTGVRYETFHQFENGFKLVFGARAWIPYFYDYENNDIAQYRGIYELTFTLSDFLGKYFELNDLTFRMYPGGKFYINPFQGGRELTFRIKGKSAAFLANVVFQVFEGYGENLLEYNHHVWGLRVGMGI